MDTYNETLDTFMMELPLAHSPYSFPAMMLVYLMIVTGLGQRYMRDRKPYTVVKKLIPLYNIFQILANGYIVYYALQDKGFVYKALDNLCGTQTPDTETMKKFILLGYLWCWIKVSDFLDTLFFIALKKNGHVSFLHVYHHSTTMLVAFVVYRYLHTEQSLVYAAVNCIVHVVMYTYYLMTSLGLHPTWKKIVTILQLTQFFGLMIMTMYLLTCQCKPRYFYYSVFGMYQTLMYMYLFGKFYFKSYLKKVE